jgi:class 3 adenylate cyclase
MDFLDVVDQVVALLRNRGRITYRALKRQFHLDDDVLEDLKTEIITGQQLAADEDGTVLVWTGGAATIPLPSPAPLDTLNTRPQAQSPTVTSPLAIPPPPDAERRQLTVMFCDLADATTLSGQLDPEDLRAVLRVYQQTCAEGIQRYEGHIAQYLGDGILVYFGWPQAHEDDAQRAVHAGIGILTAMQRLNTRLQQHQGIRLAVRIGIHTGPVVVGEIGGDGRHEHLALGDTPNIAARLQGLATPDSVVISEATFRLVEGYCTCEPLGTQTLKGISHPIPVYHVLGVGVARSRVEVATRRGLTPLVGREQEVGVLLERWAQVQDGQGQVVLLSGEAGIGKSRLLHVFTEHLAGTPHARLECRSSPYNHDSALYPLMDLLQRALHAPSPDGTQEPHVCLEKLLEQYSLATAETVPLLACLLSIPLPDGRYPPLTMSPQQQRQKTLEALLAFVLAQAAQQPVLFILEDLHWTDPSTLEWLTLLIAQVPTIPLLTLLTCRPEFHPPWGHRSYLTSLALQRFTRGQIETMVLRVTGDG